MESDIKLNGEKLELHGTVLELHGNVTAIGQEITSTGNGAGFAFFDRADTKNRYVWYADKNTARLWRDDVGDILTITDTQIKFNKDLGMITNGTAFITLSNVLAKINYQSNAAITLDAGGIRMFGATSINGSLSVDAQNLKIKIHFPNGFVLSPNIPQLTTPGEKVAEKTLQEMFTELSARLTVIEEKLKIPSPPGSMIFKK